MAQELYSVAVLIPAGTLPSAPAVTPITLPPREYVLLDIMVPPGPQGAVGFALGFANTPIIPTNRGGWIISDDEKFELALDNYPDTGAWQFTGYNTGLYDHTIYLRFHANPLTQPGSSAPQLTLISNTDLSLAGSTQADDLGGLSA
jgi:hypothetical protein